MDNLYSDNINTQPRDFNFGEGYAESWELITPDFEEWTAEQCGTYLEGQGYTIEKLERAKLVEGLESIGVACYDDEDTDLLREAYLDSVTAGDLGDIDELREQCRERFDETEQPMMNYYYPIALRGDESEAASALLAVSLPLCLVRIADDNRDLEEGATVALALTGGGQDLSAEICQAYIALGQRPPVHFCDVPTFAGRDYDSAFVATLIESCEIQQRWAHNTIHSLRRKAAKVGSGE